jgi:F-type H+-transporting ATPase subunit epsilon
MADKLHFELVSPERLLASREVTMVVAPGEEGQFGVLAGHAPFMSTIQPGVVLVYADSMTGVPERIFVNGGFAEVGDKGLTILAEEAVPVAELNAETIAKHLADAREDVAGAKSAGEKAIAEKALARLTAMQAAIVN